MILNHLKLIKGFDYDYISSVNSINRAFCIVHSSSE
jgi:tRNA uridine 5-carbamoylmethylation protein Kti12